MPFPSPWSKKPPASLIRRLGEAADGFRGKGEAYYAVALQPDADGNHKVEGPYRKEGDVPAAIADKLKKGKEWGWFGPLHTPGPAITSSVTITKFEISTTSPSKVEIDGTLYDCLFYSISAIEKFAIPYYARMFGGDYVKRLHASVTADGFLLMMHWPGTEYKKIPPPGKAPTDGWPPPSPGIAAVVRIKPSVNDGKATIEYILP